jgi:hypothetical protein
LGPRRMGAQTAALGSKPRFGLKREARFFEGRLGYSRSIGRVAPFCRFGQWVAV